MDGTTAKLEANDNACLGRCGLAAKILRAIKQTIRKGVTLFIRILLSWFLTGLSQFFQSLLGNRSIAKGELGIQRKGLGQKGSCSCFLTSFVMDHTGIV